LSPTFNIYKYKHRDNFIIDVKAHSLSWLM
jgi:hypothetical protein